MTPDNTTDNRTDVLAATIAKLEKQFGVGTIMRLGDEHFRGKCVNRLNEFKEQGKTTIFVSHDMGAVKSMCQWVILMDKGEVAEQGTADSGDLEADLPDLLVVVAQAARQAEKPVTLLIDEVQYLTELDLAALIVSMHKIGQKSLPFLIFGAGLPQLAALAGGTFTT